MKLTQLFRSDCRDQNGLFLGPLAVIRLTTAAARDSRRFPLERPATSARHVHDPVPVRSTHIYIYILFVCFTHISYTNGAPAELRSARLCDEGRNSSRCSVESRRRPVRLFGGMIILNDQHRVIRELLVALTREGE